MENGWLPCQLPALQTEVDDACQSKDIALANALWDCNNKTLSTSTSFSTSGSTSTDSTSSKTSEDTETTTSFLGNFF